jgi:hypothetical protein
MNPVLKTFRIVTLDLRLLLTVVRLSTSLAVGPRVNLLRRLRGPDTAAEEGQGLKERRGDIASTVGELQGLKEKDERPVPVPRI